MANLRDLGLSEYEARAYRALLEAGPTTAKELSRASDVPMGRIYDVLNSLETYNLVRAQTASRPKKYLAVEPDTALDRLLEDKKRELEAEKQQYEDLVDDLVDELDRAEPVDERFWTAAIGPDEALELLVERVTAADDRIIIVGAHLGPQFDMNEVGERFLEALEEALDRGVDVSLLFRPELVAELPETVGARYRASLQQHERFQVRTSENVTGTFEVIDENEVCIEVPHPLDADEMFAIIDLKDREFVGNVRAAFEPRWDEAKELRL
ncbi:TrmB family transcriptional regulator [Haloarculaceae archaeon H-GB2-1]|nr:TrmB family transcriptional regulator [Haloarculaceae archaeon H-GB1-1]MEA5388569.1 TrmB family transcriptional regulator [Haloarculaceae archaeon H-GB11]MEA5406623.1 TrmB family transcriptional regulator [Haloarculaceae archaeon H-GB2-1]